ncbi:hypothetical protein [Serratia ureilytica]|uniref:hypothetical protein n=1 Tax=Serratia ureilytica TaxID=300181 RepID=UPI0018D6E7B3|nr:hypothetical protein [Serratia ureilytica]MBH3122431.1 hypothetical protein [Serratia ureilytica]
MKEANVVSSSPTEEEKHQLKKLLEKYPNFVFQQLNKRMNQDGLILSIRTLSERDTSALPAAGNGIPIPGGSN